MHVEVTEIAIGITSEICLLILLFTSKTVEVTIPEIEVMRLAHYSTIASECSTSLSSYLEKLYVDFNHNIYQLIYVGYTLRLFNPLNQGFRTTRMGCKSSTCSLRFFH